ncbi:GPW/gp25 family protein [Lewinella sp. IMCC34191]|uniref:GPW/gp25 family protein n=1 Tax=Lewinella sp. IMCC34191 TaxID=2259172 RepID=UPI000E289766|nr:GPW/gp25 family protein [Lewinella sp. IMCC34191]
MKNYALPTDFTELMRPGGRAPTVDLHESVRQYILLMLISHFGSLRADPAFGCAFWEYDFESGAKLENRRHQLEESIRTMITEREPRLDPTTLKVNFRVFNSPLPSYRGRRMLSLKKRIEMQVTGRLLQTNTDFAPPPFQLYFSPVAIEHTNDR